MVRKKKFIKIDFDDIPKFGGDTLALFWYSALKGYEQSFKKDKQGYTRVSSATIEKDFGYNRMKVWRYNRKLADIGAIAVDQVIRGGRTWMGFKILW